MATKTNMERATRQKLLYSVALVPAVFSTMLLAVCFPDAKMIGKGLGLVPDTVPVYTAVLLILSVTGLMVSGRNTRYWFMREITALKRGKTENADNVTMPDRRQATTSKLLWISYMGVILGILLLLVFGRDPSLEKTSNPLLGLLIFTVGCVCGINVIAERAFKTLKQEVADLDSGVTAVSADTQDSE